MWIAIVFVVLWCMSSPFAFMFGFARYHDTVRIRFPWWDKYLMSPIVLVLMFPSLIALGVYTLYRKFA